MSTAKIEVLGIGNAIVDVQSQSNSEFLVEQELAKGAMTLIDGARAEALYDAMGPGRETSGGSAANTIAGVAALGGNAAYIGKVRNDQLGGIFRHDIRAAGVQFDSPPATDGAATARCLIFVTPDAQRTMATFLGVSVDFRPEDVKEESVREAGITYLEGYLWDSERAKAAFLKAAEISHAAGNQVALTLSDPFCVDRHRDSFRDLVSGHVDLLFANEAEIKSLYEVDDFDQALQAVRPHCRVVALTRGEKGAVILSGEEVHIIDAAPVESVVDTTGAGDLFASGFLTGMAKGLSLHDCGRLGAIAAGEIISHFGARPETDLKRLAGSLLQ